MIDATAGAPHYVKPAVLELSFESDVSVSMAQNCKTAGSANAAGGRPNCGAGAPGRNCQTQGS